MQHTKHYRGLDFFRQQKEDGYHGSLQSMVQLASWLIPQLSTLSSATQQHTWDTLVQVCLWGNKCDLSISAGDKAVASGDPVTALQSLQKNILTDNKAEAWQCLVNKGNGATVDIVMDNSGFELFTDLCLADFLVSSGLAAKVRMRVKDQPWFVSDTTAQDITWTINQLSRGLESTALLAELARRWSSYFDTGVWDIMTDGFWTFPHPFSLMATTDPELYQDLGEADLIIFKGDLNYRKLVGDLNWETTVPLETALKGFLPSPLVSLRTAKADVMVGLEPGQAELVTKLDPNWMVTGHWGVIQFAS
jgi:uncharacterized protein with ATP-grasp and redox domains